MKRVFFTLISLIFILMLNSCYDHYLHQIHVQTFINNRTNHNIHVLYGKKDNSMPDSIFFILNKGLGDSVKNKGLIQGVLDSTFMHHDNPLTKSEFVDFISKFKLFYIEQGDTFKITDKFYDGVSSWETNSQLNMDGIMFIRYYYWVEYTVIITDDMFKK